ncbi:MAG: SDR family NAD(P)-dependent oxidoreductase, partial [Nitrospinota bacterium]
QAQATSPATDVETAGVEGSGQAKGSAQWDAERLTAKLLQIVSERTGYPPEMLDLDLDMEADLGIDSIKRVEILGALQRTCFPSEQHRLQAAMDELTRLKTLRSIIDWFCSSFQAQAEKEEEESPVVQQERVVSPPQGAPHQEDTVSRFLLKEVEVPLPEASVSIPAGALFLLTDDGQGVAHTLAAMLRQCGGQAIIVQQGEKACAAGEAMYTADLTDPHTVEGLIELIHRQHGPLSGIIHLLPLQRHNPFEEMDLQEWKRVLRLEVKSLFYLTKAASADLGQAAQAGGGWVVAATALGGGFGSAQGSLPPSSFPGQGGITGFVKALATEWPEVWCKTVDFDPQETSSQIWAERLLQEMTGGDREVEVGYREGRRLVLRPYQAPLSSSDLSQLAIDSDWVILVTGGARGITADIAHELARRYRPTLLLVGRSPLPPPEDPPEIAFLSSPQEIKAALIAQRRQAGQPVTPAEIEAEYTRLSRAREIRTNLAALQQAGARVHYYQVDVRDEAALGALIAEIYRSLGRLDGVIHGAGIIEDKLVKDKPPEAFDRVFDTKADSAFILGRHLRGDTLKFLVFFSSIAGRFGNRGQGDYAAANEVLNKLALCLDRRYPGRVVSLNWGPWGKTGMVSPEVERQFRERGVQLIPPDAGRRAFHNELLWGPKGAVEVVIGEGPWCEMATPRS